MEDHAEPSLVEATTPGAELVGEPHSEPEYEGSAVRAVKSNLWATLFVQALNITSGIELARGLGLEGRGELAAAILWPTVLGAIATLGLEESMTYHVARRRDPTGRLLGSGLAIWGIQSVLFTAATLVVVPIALQRHDSSVIHAGLIYSGYVSLNMVAVMLNGTLNGLHRYSWYNAVRVSIGVFLVGSLTLLLALDAFTVTAIVIGFIASYVANALFVAFLVYRTRPGRLQSDRSTMRRIWGYGIRSNASTTSSFLNQRLDQLVISAFLTASQLGLYVVAVTFTLLTPLVGASIGAGALPNVAKLETREERVLIAKRLISGTAVVSVLLSLPIIVLASFLITLFFGSDFSAGANITRIVAVGSVAFSISRVLEAILRGVGQPLAAGAAEFVALGATAVGLAVLLPTLGLIGAAWASLMAYAVACGWMMWRISLALSEPIPSLLVPDREGVEMARAGLRGLRERWRGSRMRGS